MTKLRKVLLAVLCGAAISMTLSGCSGGTLSEDELRSAISQELSNRYSQSFEIEELKIKGRTATGKALSVSQGECSFTVSTSGKNLKDGYSAFIYGEECSTIITGIIDSHTDVIVEDEAITYRESSETYESADDYLSGGAVLITGTFSNKNSSNENVDDLTGLISDLQTKGIGLKIEAYARNHKLNISYDKLAGDSLLDMDKIWNKLQ